MYLSTAEADAIDKQIGPMESRTGVQIVTAVVGKSDNYAELPWKAFGLGASLAGIAIVLVDARWPNWVTSHTALLHATTVLGAALACALAAIAAPPFARLFLSDARRDLEVRQHAESLFLRRELFATRGRRGVLIFVSLFERRIEILPDTGLRGRISEADWQSVIASMTPQLAAGRPFHALQEGLSALEALLVARGFQRDDGPNELPDRPIEERGA